MTVEQEGEAILQDLREWSSFQSDPNDPPPNPIERLGAKRKNPLAAGMNAYKGRAQQWCFICGRKGKPAQHGWGEHLEIAAREQQSA